jgi:hypothetical protein
MANGPGMRSRLRSMTASWMAWSTDAVKVYGINNAGHAVGSQRFYKLRGHSRPKSTHLGCEGLVLSAGFKVTKIAAWARSFAKVTQ